jgi:glycosyltransferase involved in cell wall biosynthesis
MPSIAFILQTFYGDHIGGAERQVQILSQGLRDCGWKTAYICERERDKPRFEVVEGMQVFALPERKKRAAWKNYSKLKAAVTESKADILYQRMRHPYTGLSALAAQALKKPLVWAAASTADVIRGKDLRFASYAFAFRDALMHPLNRRLEDYGVRHADAVVLQTAQQKKLLQDHYRREGIVIPNHIVFSEDFTVTKRNPPEILWISNIKPFKRPDLFLRLAGDCADLAVNFVMIGACPDRESLLKIKETENNLQNFRYLGPLEPELAQQRIASAALLVNTSLFEGFPNAFQQAWLYGVPTLSLGVDPDGVIVREKIGFCHQTYEELLGKLRQLIAHPDEIVRMGIRSSEFARKEYNFSRLFPRYIWLFEKLLRHEDPLG